MELARVAEALISHLIRALPKVRIVELHVVEPRHVPPRRYLVPPGAVTLFEEVEVGGNLQPRHKDPDISTMTVAMRNGYRKKPAVRMRTIHGMSFSSTLSTSLFSNAFQPLHAGCRLPHHPERRLVDRLVEGSRLRIVQPSGGEIGLVLRNRGVLDGYHTEWGSFASPAVEESWRTAPASPSPGCSSVAPSNSRQRRSRTSLL